MKPMKIFYDGAAFPIPLQYVSPGMTKLEAFTMAAMQGLCARSGNAILPVCMASDAVEIAKATLDKLTEDQK